MRRNVMKGWEKKKKPKNKNKDKCEDTEDKDKRREDDKTLKKKMNAATGSFNDFKK